MPDEGKIIKPDRPMICEIDLEEEVVGTVIESLTPSVRSLPGGEENQTKEHSRYYKLLQGKGTNALAQISNKSFITDPMKPDTAIAEANGVKVITNDINKKVDGNTLRVYDALTMKMTANLPHGNSVPLEAIDKARHVTLTVREYMNLCGKSDRKAAREQLNEAITTLYGLSLEWNEKFYDIQEGSTKATYHDKHWHLRIIDSYGDDLESPVQNGEVDLYFSMSLAKYFTQASIMPHAVALFKVNLKKHPNAYHIGRELELHHNMNLGKQNENRISVLTLLKATPGIPSYDEVMSTSRQVTRDIIRKLEDGLLALERDYHVLESWNYCNSGGLPLTEKQIDAYNYDEWSGWLVDYKLRDYPAQEQKRLHRAEAQGAAQENKEKKKEKSGK